MGEQEPEAEDGLGQDVKNGIGDNLRVNIRNARAIGDTPDAIAC